MYFRSLNYKQTANRPRDGALILTVSILLSVWAALSLVVALTYLLLMILTLSRT